METSIPWGGTTTGDATAAPYDDDEFSDMLRELITADRTTECVVRTNVTNYDGLLAVTNPSGTTVRVASGVGFVDGKMYYNDANIDFAAGTAGQYYRVVLRKSWAGQTVRAAILGPGAVAPALTQTDGVTWEVPLATIYNSGGVLSITDERIYVNRVLSGMFAAGAISNVDIADNAVTDTKVGARVPQFYRRQGGSATIWNTTGTTDYTPDYVRMQGGVVNLLLSGAPPLGSTAVTFPQAFSYTPIVYATVGALVSGTSYPAPRLYLSAASSSGFTVYSREDDAVSPTTWSINWLAIGPE